MNRLPGALLLAAGSSRRFGADKRRARLADGRGVLAASLAACRPVFADLRLVVRPGDEALALAHGVAPGELVVAADAALGMGHSLAAAAAAVPGDWPGCALLLGDMPWVRSTTLLALRDAFVAAADPALVLRPQYAGRAGHPVLFGRVHLPALQGLSGDRGARDLLAALPVQSLPVDDPGVLADLDHPGDLGGP